MSLSTLDAGLVWTRAGVGSAKTHTAAREATMSATSHGLVTPLVLARRARADGTPGRPGFGGCSRRLSAAPPGSVRAMRRRIVIIGATGHVGTYLVPRLVRAGHEVIALSRGEREPYSPAAEWQFVERVTIDREAEDAAATFGERIAALAPDVVVDMICFTADSARALVEALRPSRPLLLHCGTIWVHGPARRVPITEDEPRSAFGDYGVGKAEIEHLLQRETLAGGVPSVILHPGHITGPGWPVIT